MTHDRETVRRLLERDLIEWADNTDLRLVWADLLQLDGDPLGRLVMLDHVGASRTAPAAVAERARAEAEQLRRQLGPRLWTEPPPELPGLTLIWRLGFVDELRVDGEQVRDAVAPPTKRRRGRARGDSPGDRLRNALDWLLPRLLAQPAMRWIDRVHVECDDELSGYATSWIRCGKLKNDHLREIHIGRPARARSRPGGAWESTQASSFAHVSDDAIASLRRLRQISVAGELCRLACAPGNSQTRVHLLRKLEQRPLTSQNRAILARALFDASTLVHGAAFEVATRLGPTAAFLVDELVWFLRPPLRPKDPRPVAALRALAAIGPASAGPLAELLQDPSALVRGDRLVALVAWLAALGPAAKPARGLIQALRRGNHGVVPAEAKPGLERAYAAITS